MAYAFPAFLFAMLTLTGFWSLRWTKLDPQYPVPPHPWRIIATSAGAAALVLLSHTGAPLATITAAGAVGMITKTAIIPPVKITAQEVPDWRSRAWRRFSSAALGGVVLSLLLGVGFSISSWLPFSNQLPGWLGAYAIL